MNLGQAIASSSQFYSLEFFPPKDQALWPKFMETAKQLRSINPLFTSVTYGAGGGTQENTLAITTQLVQAGFETMAHLTCVGATEEKIDTCLGLLRASGVSSILALRGDAPQGQHIDWQKERFRHASDLVRYVRERHSDFSIGVAAYPTSHPQSLSFIDDRAFTRYKLDAGGDFAITQLFFDPREYSEYVSQMRHLGVLKPIIPGVLPIQSLESIKRILALSGGNIPAKLYIALEEAHAKGGTKAVQEAGIVFAVEQIKRLLDMGAPGIHLYTLNKAEMCLRIVSEVGALTPRPIRP